jgi:monoamine oxidase
VTAPPNVAGQIQFDPPLPAAHGQLLRKMPAGAILRFIAVYDTPFWRAKGLSGFTVAPQSQFPVTIDQCPNGPEPKGVLSSYVIGANAVQLALLAPEERKAICLAEIASRVGDEALEPVAFSDTDWSTEQWTQGGMIGHFPTGVLTSYGHVLHEPAGRVYFAGTERATAMHGLIEGAVRSGEEAAADVMKRLA